MAGTTKTLEKAIVFPVAGHFMLQRYDKNGILDPTQFYSSAHGIVKSIKRANALTTSEMADGNSVYAAKEYPTKEENTITIGLSTYDAELEAFLKGIDLTETTADIMSVMEAISIPADGIVVLGNKVKDATFRIFAKDKLGNVFEKAETTATTGQYTAVVAENVATLTFTGADEGKELYLVYDAQFANIAKMKYSEKAKIIPMQVTIIGEANSFDEVQTYVTNIVIDKATSSGGITPPEQTNDPTGGWEITLKTGKPRAGKQPVEVSFGNN